MKHRYTPERFRVIAETSTKKALDNLPNALTVESLSCEYIHKPTPQELNRDGSLRRDAALCFRWHLQCPGYNETCDVDARCNNVTERSVPFPDHWRTALQCLHLDSLAKATVKFAVARLPVNLPFTFRAIASEPKPAC